MLSGEHFPGANIPLKCREYERTVQINAEVIQMYAPAILLVKRKKEEEDEDFKEEEWEDDDDEEWEDDDSDDMEDEEE